MWLIPKTDKTRGIRLTDIGVSTCWYRPITCILWSILGVSNQSHFFCRVARLWRNMSCRTSRNYCLLVAVLCTLVFIYSIPGSRRIILQVCYVMLCNHSFSSVCNLFIFHQLATFYKRTSRSIGAWVCFIPLPYRLNAWVNRVASRVNTTKRQTMGYRHQQGLRDCWLCTPKRRSHRGPDEILNGQKRWRFFQRQCFWVHFWRLASKW